MKHPDAVEVSMERPVRGSKKLSRIEIEPARRGSKKFMGASVHHHHEYGPMMEHASEHHAFGPNDGGKLLAHIGKHLGIPNSAEEASEEDHANVGHETEVEVA